MRLSIIILGLAIAAVLPPASQAAAITVGPEGCDYTSIQAAINAASPGDAVEVQSGTYRENVNVDKNLTLKGVGMPVVDAGGADNAIALSADGIWLEGFVATNTSTNWPNVGIIISSNDNIIRGNDVRDNRGAGIIIDCFSSNNIIEGNNVRKNNGGIHVYDSTFNNTISYNIVSDNEGDGIYLHFSFNNTISGNIVSNNQDYGFYLYGSRNNAISSNNVKNNSCGIRFEFSESNTMKDNLMSDNRYNFGADGDNEIDISNLVDGKPIYYLVRVSDIVIDTSSNAGVVYCIGCKNITVKGLTLRNNRYGISFYNTFDSRIENNNINNNYFGIDFERSSRNTMKDNLISDNQYNFGVDSLSVEVDCHNDIDTSNLVDGKPIYYLVGASDNVLDSSSNAGAVYCIECQNITIKGLTLKNNRHGIYFRHTYNSRMVDNSVSDSINAIRLKSSSNNTIEGNNANGNSGVGIYLSESSNNTIKGNNVRYNNDDGIFVSDSGNNTIEGNNASDNCHGVYIWFSCNNTVENNNLCNNSCAGVLLSSSSNNSLFINNIANNKALDHGANQWDNGSVGNYYSDFGCTDSGGDGICDSGYEIPGGGSVDRYPLSRWPWD